MTRQLDELADDESGVRLMARADRDVDWLRNEIDPAGSEVEFEGDARVALRECGQDGSHHRDGEVNGQRNTQRADRLIEHLAELLMGDPRLVDDPPAPFVIELTGLGRLDGSRGAVE